MQPEIHAAKLFSRILVVAGSPADYFMLRFGLTNRGYRNFSIAYDRVDLARQLRDALPDIILIASSFGERERRELVECIQHSAPGYAAIHTIDVPGRIPSQPLLSAQAPEIDTLEGKFTAADIPLNIELELTSRCNARCSFCPIESMSRLNRVMSEERLDGILSALKAMNPSLIYLCGVGEPLLFRGIVDVVKRISYEIGCPVGINTNGQLLTAERFQSLVDAGISLINVSINGVTEEVYGQHMKHCSLEKARANIDSALQIKPEAISLQGVITKKNHHEIPELIRYWTDKGVKIFTFNQCSNKSGFLDDFEDLWFDDLPRLYEGILAQNVDSWISINSCNFAVRQTGRFVCKVPMNFISVDVDGNILHCMHDFRSVTEYGQLTDYTPERLNGILMERVLKKASICEGCNACKLEPSTLIWNGQVVMEKEVFDEVAPWELALAQSTGRERGGAVAALADPLD